MDYMRSKWKSEYVKVFNQDKFHCLRNNDSLGKLLNFKQICDMIKDDKSDQVRLCIPYLLCVVCLFCESLNFNCHVCNFLY